MSSVLIPGLDDAPMKRLADGTWAADGPALHLRGFTKRFGQMPSAAERLAKFSSLLFPDRGCAPCGEGRIPGSGLAKADGSSRGGHSAPGTVHIHGESVWFGYRDTEFTVPTLWYLMYRADLAEQHAGNIRDAYGMVSGVNDFIDFAWADFASAFRATGVSDAVWLGMLSCYNLPRKTMPTDIDAQFWHSGWGTPYWVNRTISALVMTYSAYIVDTCTDAWQSDGFDVFVRNVLSGFTETDLAGGSCKLLFRFLNDDTENARIGGTMVTGADYEGGDRAGEHFECDWGFIARRLDGIRPVLQVKDPGQKWNSALPPGAFDATANEWVPGNNNDRSHPSTDMFMPYRGETGSYTAYVGDGTWMVTRRPEDLAWYGYVIDWIMYTARVAYDYAGSALSGLSDDEREAYRLKSYELGRYALRILVRAGHTLIHELGHVHNGVGGHCRSGHCYMELAAQRWACKLIATLGLPLNAGTATASDTWSNRSYCGTNTHCTDNNGDFAVPEYLCAVIDPGDLATTWSFRCVDCSTDDIGWRARHPCAVARLPTKWTPVGHGRL